MSQENVELRALAEAAVEALNSADLDRFLALTTEDVEFTSLIAEAEGTTFRGRDGVRTWWETVVASFQDVRWEMLELITVADDRGGHPTAHHRDDRRRPRRTDDVASEQGARRENQRVGVISHQARSPRSRRAAGIATGGTHTRPSRHAISQYRSRMCGCSCRNTQSNS